MEDYGLWRRLGSRVLVWGLLRTRGAILVLVGTVALAGVASASLSARSHAGTAGGPDQGTVYTVAAVDTGLRQDPGQWLGGLIQVRGTILPCMPIPSAGGGPCAELAPQSALSGATAAAPLPVIRTGLVPLLALLRQVPLLDRLAPAPQVLHWGTVWTYRLQLATSTDSLCGTGACVEARLLDASR